MRLHYFFLALLLAACSTQEPSAPPVGATIEPPAQSDLTYVRVAVVAGQGSTTGKTTLTASGTVVSDQLARPSSKTGGLLSTVLFREGDDVRRGQVLARIDATEFEAGVAQAEAALTKAQRDLARVEALFADSVATRTQRDDAATGVEVATRQLESIRFNRSQDAITAPIAGRIVQKLANSGETVGPGTPVAIIQGTKADDWRIRVGLTDAQWALTTIGQSATVRFDAFPGQTFAARLTERATAADPASATFPVELQLKQQPPSLAAGLVAQVSLTSTQAQSTSSTASAGANTKAVFIPISALGRVAGKRAEVFTATRGAALARDVQLGEVRAGKVDVLTGLQPGDSLITTGVAWLRHGDPVRVVR